MIKKYVWCKKHILTSEKSFLKLPIKDYKKLWVTLKTI